MIADCAATMRDMRGDWEAVAAAGAAAVARRASSLQQPVETPAADVEIAGQPAAAAEAEAGFGHDGASSHASGSSSPSAAASAAQQSQEQMQHTGQQQLQQQQQQPAVPNMMQLLQLLAYAPPGICSTARVVLVPEAAQALLFAHQGEEAAVLQQLQQLSEGAAASAYSAQGIRIVLDAAAASQVCDHLMACPILAFGVCCSSSSGSSGGKEVPVLLQVLAPPTVSNDVAVEAAVYVFDVRGQQQQQSAALLTLLNILLEDVRVVKLVDDAAHVSCKFIMSSS
jgi:hypothetical protein